jgi:hypothetical protein
MEVLGVYQSQNPPRNTRVGAHRLRPTSVFSKPQEFSDSMDSIGWAHGMRPYPLELIDLTSKISGIPLKNLNIQFWEYFLRLLR